MGRPLWSAGRKEGKRSGVVHRYPNRTVVPFLFVLVLGKWFLVYQYPNRTVVHFSLFTYYLSILNFPIFNFPYRIVYASSARALFSTIGRERNNHIWGAPKNCHFSFTRQMSGWMDNHVYYNIISICVYSEVNSCSFAHQCWVVTTTCRCCFLFCFCFVLNLSLSLRNTIYCFVSFPWIGPPFRSCLYFKKRMFRQPGTSVTVLTSLLCFSFPNFLYTFPSMSITSWKRVLLHIITKYCCFPPNSEGVFRMGFHYNHDELDFWDWLELCIFFYRGLKLCYVLWTVLFAYFSAVNCRMKSTYNKVIW